jgi:hypothetical protein
MTRTRRSHADGLRIENKAVKRRQFTIVGLAGERLRWQRSGRSGVLTPPRRAGNGSVAAFSGDF